MVGLSVGDRVVSGADKVLGNKPAKQRYGRLFQKELQGVVKGTEGSGRSKKYVVYNYEGFFHSKLEAASSCAKLDQALLHQMKQTLH